MEYEHGKFWSLTIDKPIYLNHNSLIKKTIRKLGRFTFIALFFLSGILSAQSFSTVDFQEVSSFLEEVQTYRSGYTNYKVQFREYTDNGLLIGDLYYAEPQQMRITYYRGNEIVTEVFLGPEKLIVYFVSSAIVYEQENFNTYKTENILMPGSLDYLISSYNFNFIQKEPVMLFEDEDYRLFNFTRPPEDLAYHLRLTPKSITEGLDDLEIWLLAEKTKEEGDYYPTQVIRSRLLSKEGSSSDIYFSKISVNQKFPADIFNFVIPANVRIVKNYLPILEDVILKEDLEISE